MHHSPDDRRRRAGAARAGDRRGRERRYLGSTEGFTREQTAATSRTCGRPDGVPLVALEEDRLVGWVDIARGPFEGLTHYGRLGMGLAADARGRGLGRALLERALDGGLPVHSNASNWRCSPRTRAPWRSTGARDSSRKAAAAARASSTASYDDILMFGLLRDEWRP